MLGRGSALERIDWQVQADARAPLGARAMNFAFRSLPLKLGLPALRGPDDTIAVIDALASVGAPAVETGGPRDEAVALLQAAAEIEHALLIEYLYAAFSVKAAPELRSCLIEVAIQEMAHLITVQNLLLFLGAPPYLSRQDLSPNPDLDPFPFLLSGAAHGDTLERFVLAEMPDPETLPQPTRDRVAEMRARLDPGGKYRRVGLLYARIYWLLQDGPSPQGPWPGAAAFAASAGLRDWHLSDFAGAASATTTQASRAEHGPRAGGEGEIWWQDYGVEGVFKTVASRQEALAALHEVAAQGEGIAAPESEVGPLSHFSRFYEQLSGGHPASAFLKLVDNPSLVAGPGRTEVTDALAVALCHLLDNRYQIMMAALAAAFHYSRAEPVQNERRQKLVGWAFFEMKFSLKVLARDIVRRPSVEGGSASTAAAGPTFGLEEPPDPPEHVQDIETWLATLHGRTPQLIGQLDALGWDSGNIQKIAAEDADRYPS